MQNLPFSRDDYIESVDSLLHGNATKRQFVLAVTGWQDVVEGELDDTTMEFAVSRRTVWKFPTGMCLVTSPRYAPHISDLNKRVEYDPPAPVSCENHHKWLSEIYVNGWRPAENPISPASVDEILDALDDMETVNGTPELIIPWINSWASNNAAAEDLDAYGLQGLSGTPDRLLLLQSVQVMFKLAIEGELDKQSPWRIEYTPEEAYMSPHCGYMEFKGLLDEVEKRQMAIVVRNASLRATRDPAYELEIRAAYPGKDELPILWVPMDGANVGFHPSGWVYEQLLFVDDMNLERELYILADEVCFGLRPRYAIEELDEEWEPEGIFYIESEFEW